MKTATITYRGWAGHFICAHSCKFRLNTLIELDEVRIVVSTVGLMELDGKIEPVGFNRYYETMAFHARRKGEFWDADFSREVDFDSPWSHSRIEYELAANDGHIAVVAEIARDLEAQAARQSKEIQ